MSDQGNPTSARRRLCAAPPVGTRASAVLVDLAGCGSGFRAEPRLPSSARGPPSPAPRRPHAAARPRRGRWSTRLVSFSSPALQFVQVFPRRHAEGERQQVAGAAHVEGVFGEPADVALDDHQILRAVARRLGVVGAVAHPDLVDTDVGRFRHVALLAGQQQEHAHRLAIGFRRDGRASALPGACRQADADRGRAGRDCGSAGRA